MGNSLALVHKATVLKYLRDGNPIIFGYGAGVRTTVLGYFIKLDYGWGFETKQVRDPILHFSIGTDF